MADYDSSLPVRTESAGDIDVFISDSTTPSQKLLVNANGSIDVNALLQAGAEVIIRDAAGDQLEINADGSINVAGTDIDIRDLQFAQDSVDVSGSSVSITGTVDVSGSTVTVTATALDIRPLDSATDSVTIVATDLDIRDLSASSDSVAAHLFDEAGVAFSLSNPLPVEMVSDQAGDEIVDYQTSAAVAKDASVNHDYTVTAAKTFLGEEAWISGSGKLKVDMLVNGLVVFTGFNSTANPNIRIPLEKIVKANAAEVIRFTITNRDNQAQDLYSTLIGLEV